MGKQMIDMLFFLGELYYGWEMNPHGERVQPSHPFAFGSFGSCGFLHFFLHSFLIFPGRGSR